jgi:hypothetical protein
MADSESLVDLLKEVDSGKTTTIASSVSKPKSFKGRPDDLISMCMEGIKGIDFKTLFILFVIFIFITSDVFVQNALGKFPALVEGRDTTNTGNLVQGGILVAVFGAMGLLVDNHII